MRGYLKRIRRQVLSGGVNVPLFRDTFTLLNREGAPVIERVLAGLHDVGDGAEAEVVIGGEDDDFTASFHLHPRPLR